MPLKSCLCRVGWKTLNLPVYFSQTLLDLFFVRISNAAPICENCAKLSFDAKHLEKGLIGSGEIFGAFFPKKNCPLGNIERYHYYLD